MLPKPARVTFTALTTLSLVLCLSACAMWVRSFIVSDHVVWVHDDSAYDVGEFGLLYARSDAGAVRFTPVRFTLFQGPVDPEYARSISVSGGWSRRPPNRSAWRENLVPWLARDRAAGPNRTLRLPYWLIVLGSAALPATRLAATRRRRRRAAQGQCPACGYDLRASPGRCPECGKIPDSG